MKGGFTGSASAAVFALLTSAIVPVHAQSFDCAKASTPVETAICASDDLRAADAALAQGFARALTAADAEHATQLRGGQRAWLGERNACGLQAGADLSGCLLHAYRARTTAIEALAVTTAAPAFPPSPPPAAASLSRTNVPAAADSEALLTVTSAGRFAIRTKSRTGVALQIVDMIAGPGDSAGDAGLRDGRLDVLLDKGVYKLRLTGAKIAPGEAELSVTPFASTATDTALLRGGESAATLADTQQRSAWVLVGRDKRLSVEATGRALRDLRAWRYGTDLSELLPAPTGVEPKAGHPMARLTLDGTTEPGLYLVTAYGGEPQVWSDGDRGTPLYLRVGPPPFLPGGAVETAIGPSGTLRFALPTGATYARLDLPEIVPVRLAIHRGTTTIASAAVAKTTREAVTSVRFAAAKDNIAEITGFAGQRIKLRALAPASSARADDAGAHVIGVDLAGEGGDEAPATAIFARFDKSGGKGQVLASTALRVASGTAWRRKFNLRGPMTLLVEVAGAGPVAARLVGVGARVTLEPLLGTNAPRADGKRPRQWDVEAGFYTLRIDPVANAVGVINLTFGQPDLVLEPTPAAPSRETIDFGLVTFERGSSYQILLNSAPNLVTAPRIRALPADLAAGALVLQQSAKAAVQPAPPVVSPPLPEPAPASRPQRTDAVQPSAPAPKPAQKPAPKIEGAGAKPAPKPMPVAKPFPPKPEPVLPTPSLASDKPLTISVKAPLGGTIATTDSAGRAVPFTISSEITQRNTRTVTVSIAPTDVARTLTIAWTDVSPPEPLPAGAREDDAIKLIAGTPVFFDLAKDESRTLDLDVPAGGLYRVETLGRLQTTASVGTRFLPKLAEENDNGPGHNALVQTFLRAGAYRVRVSAQESAGRLGMVSRPAKLIDAGVLIAGGSARATLADGAGASFAIDIPEAGDYRLDLYGLDRTWTARLEDAEGWPLAAPGELATLQRRFASGRYRLVVLPPDVEASVVARLRRVEPPKVPEGHGPLPLPFDASVSALWREPATKDAPRTPDRWTFALAGAARVTLATSDGMTGDLVAANDETNVLARIVKGRDFTGPLPAGRYVLMTRALGRDDRLDYTIHLKSDEMQPGAPRFVDLPASIPFAIADDRVISLTTFGEKQLSAVLRDANGDAVERLVGRTDDWNLALSRRLPAGRYTLDLASLETPKPPGDDSAESGERENADDPPRTQASGRDDAEGGDDTPATGDADASAAEREKVEVRLALPASSAPRELALSGTASATSAGIVRFALPTLDADALLLVAAQADGEIVLSLDRRGADGRLQPVGFARGRSAALAMPVGDARDGFELSAWSIDGAAVTTTVAARGVTSAPQPAGRIAMAPAGSDGPLAAWRVGHAATPEKRLLSLADRTTGLLTGSSGGRVLASSESGLLAPQTRSLWLLAPASAPETIDVEAVPSSRPALALTLAGGDIAVLPPSDLSGDRLRAWRADATDGQPGFLGGAGVAVAKNSAFALAGGDTLRVWNAGGPGELAMRLTAIDLARRPIMEGANAASMIVPPKSGQPVRLAAGEKAVTLRLGAGMAAILSGGGAAGTAWVGDEAASRDMAGAWTDALLINTTDAPTPAGIESRPAPPEAALVAGLARKQFFGAGGSVSLPVDGKVGDRLTVAGGDATFVGADGRVTRGGATTLSGPGQVVISHPPGLVIAAVENGATTPWRVAASQPTPLPSRVALAGPSASYAIHADAPMLLHVRSSAPVILQMRGGDAEPMPLGAEITRYIAAGDAELRLFSPHDGPLSGTLDLTAEPITPVTEGLGAPQVLAPGTSAVFAFSVTRAGPVGVGVRAEPDRVAVRLLDGAGAPIGDGLAQMRTLPPGRYLLEARAPADGPALTVRPAVVGLAPRPSGPPPEVAAKYLELVGMTKAKR